MEATVVKKSNHGANVRRWREWRGINQDILAEQIGVSQATLCKYEKRETLEQEILDKISTALDIPVEAITELEQGTAINIFSGTWNDNAMHPILSTITQHSTLLIKLFSFMMKRSLYMKGC